MRAGLRYAWSITELRVPLLMMTIIGTLAFNFQTVLPLFATRDLHGSDGHVLVAHVGGQRRLAGRRAPIRPAHRGRRCAR